MLIKILVIISMLFIPILLYSIYASVKVNTTFAKYQKIANRAGLTGAEAARKILNDAGLSHVDVVPTKGSLTDHYNPRDNTVYLSEATFNSSSVAAVGVAAHEVGHAIQHAADYKPLKLRAFCVPVINVSSRVTFPLLMVSILLEIFLGVNMISNTFLAIAIAFYGVYAVFTLVTLPVEFNASSRAKKQLVACGILTKDEARQTGKVLSAAAQTYVAAFLISLIQFLRLLLILLSRTNRR